jgi:hypothetical protein
MLRQPLGDGRAEPAAGPGYQCAFPFEQFHLLRFFLFGRQAM